MPKSKFFQTLSDSSLYLSGTREGLSRPSWSADPLPIARFRRRRPASEAHQRRPSREGQGRREGQSHRQVRGQARKESLRVSLKKISGSLTHRIKALILS